MSKQDKMIVAVVTVLVVIVLAVVIVRNNLAGKGQGSAASNSGGQSATRAPIAPGVTVPNQGAQDVPQNVAVPSTQSAASPNNDSEYRSFTITADNNAFTPNTVIVTVGDVVNLIITSADKAYDFTQPDYGFHVAIPEGQTKKIEFQATATGKFTFYCSSCGGPSQGPVGYIEVVSGK